MARRAATERSFEALPVKRPRKQVEDQLSEAILSGRFGHGEKLPPESELAKAFGVSRPTVHEALVSLAKTGLIRRLPGVAGGSFVNSVTHHGLSEMLSESLSTTLKLGTLDIAEVTQVRQILEVPAASYAAERRTDAHLRAMRDVLDKQRIINTSDPQVPVLDQVFHSTIAQASGNRFLAALISSVHNTTRPVDYLELSKEVGRETVKQHLAIMKAIEAGDGERAANNMMLHLEFVLSKSDNSCLPTASAAAAIG